ncbi:type I restriction endonuclease [Novipirellula herctigrandis]|uniref:type I restriction endonuclease n=1 Tax=Novipirellula herctigrandis TaxID=2527986 RepID=UPI003AF3F1B6
MCQHLASNGWLYAEKDAADYDRQLALSPADVLAWVQATQPDAWDVLVKNHGAGAGQTLLSRLRASINQTGTLHVLRQGFDVLGVRAKVKMAQFKPALAMNPDIMQRYAANRLRVVRQVHYSVHNELNIDLVLFLNGIPVATVELKTDFTQSIDDAVDQYRFDRIPNPKGQDCEPLLTFPSGALVHFAVSSSEVRMTTRLAGPKTNFLPFNKGDNGAAGNPLNPNGHKTAYLWEAVWQRDSWLDILGRYLIAERDDKKNIKAIIFPRFHQLDVTRDLLSTVLDEGPGHKYLIQHSAGSGKTKSIAWTAHFLSDLHDDNDEKVFDSVIVVSDRNVIDGQLSEAIEGMQRNKGVVATIKGKSGSKSAELAEALSGDKKIVVCTIQTFPFALETVRELAATDGKRFAVIADEAHSSQTGEAAAKLKAVLSADELKEFEDGCEISSEDILVAQMAAKANDAGITYIAFTATPKAKTLENFGRVPDPSKPKGKDNLPAPFHVYSMRQAIEEEFILDVLQNYTTYKLAFKLATGGKELPKKQVEHSEAMKGIMRWVRLHPFNISQKVQIVVEHFREMVVPLLGGKAKAMVVTGSRIEAVRWQLAINKYITNMGYPIKTLVAFSGEVNDKESGPEPFKETSATMNPNLRGREISEAFKGDEYQVLLVANKFQTGFDQPLLCAMYVDKRLAGIQAVQTLSRLNRCHPGRDTNGADLSPNTAGQHIKRCRQMMKQAIDDRLIETNPFKGIKIDLRSDTSKNRYIDDIKAVAIIEACPDQEWRTLYALARYGGLRCPSEVLRLRWSDIQWDKGRFKVTAPKTERYGKGQRIVPLWPELRAELDDLSSLAQPGIECPTNAFVIQRYRDSEANLRTTFNKIVERAGLAAFPKPFMDLRASRRTELERTGRFANHVLNDWFGHSGAIAETHYLQTTEADFSEAGFIAPLTDPEGQLEGQSRLEGQSEGQAVGQQDSPQPIKTQKKPGKTGRLMVASGCGSAQKYTPEDSNL